VARIKIACETYTWQMPGEQYKGKLEHIMEVTASAGFQGIEPETSFIQHLSDPVLMQEALDKYGLELSVLCLVEDWRNPVETESEKAHAEKWMDFLKYFPDTLLLLVQMPGKDRESLRERQQNLISCNNEIAKRAADRGIRCSNHPNSPEGSVFRTADDYEILLNGLDSSIGFTPDVGHIAKGGMDPLSIVKKYRDRVNCIHYKDMYDNLKWAPMGSGIIDFAGITKELVTTGYEGWIIVEDECDKAITDPDGVTLTDGQFVEEILKTLL